MHAKHIARQNKALRPCERRPTVHLKAKGSMKKNPTLPPIQCVATVEHGMFANLTAHLDTADAHWVASTPAPGSSSKDAATRTPNPIMNTPAIRFRG